MAFIKYWNVVRFTDDKLRWNCDIWYYGFYIPMPVCSIKVYIFTEQLNKFQICNFQITGSLAPRANKVESAGICGVVVNMLDSRLEGLNPETDHLIAVLEQDCLLHIA